MEKIAIISPASITPDNLVTRLKKFAPRSLLLESSHLSNLGTHFDLNATQDYSAHIYSPLNASFTKAFVIREFPVLYANDFTICWLVKMLLDMRDDGELYIEIPDEKVNRNKNHVSVDLLKRKLPSVMVEYVDKNWVRIPYSKNLTSDVQTLRTIYKAFHHKFDEFFDVWASNSETETADADKMRADATRTFIYSLFGANQKCFVLDRIIQEYFRGALIDGLDMGGGYGFLAAELACAGHTMQMIDYNAKNVAVGHWLAKECSVEKNLSLNIGNIEDITRHEGSYDMISYFGCLLYVDRKYIPEILRSSMALLKSSGVLIIHENPKGVIKPGNSDYDICFDTEELINYLNDNAGHPSFYNIIREWPFQKDESLELSKRI